MLIGRHAARLQPPRELVGPHAAAAPEQRDQSRGELRLGYLQNTVRGLEMDFQRLHRIMGVKFTPEKPDSVQDIVKASLSHEQRNASLLHYVGVQNGQIDALDEQVRSLEAQEALLVVDSAKFEQTGALESVAAERAAKSSEAILSGIEKRDTDLKKLGAIQRKFDDKELELHDHLDLSTACRFHLHLGLAQVAIGKDGKQHLDEAKKLADELADHDLIWLCDKHTRARASLEC